MNKDLTQLNTIFQALCGHGTVEEVKKMLSQFDNIEQVDSECLMDACFHLNKEVAQYLIGLNIGKKDSVLTNCARYNKLEIIDFLLENGADIHTTKNYPVSAAAKNNHLEMVELLIKRGANIYDDNHLTILWSVEMENEKTTEYLFSLYETEHLEALIPILENKTRQNLSDYEIKKFQLFLSEVKNKLNILNNHEKLENQLYKQSSTALNKI